MSHNSRMQHPVASTIRGGRRERPEQIDPGIRSSKLTANWIVGIATATGLSDLWRSRYRLNTRHESIKDLLHPLGHGGGRCREGNAHGVVARYRVAFLSVPLIPE